MSSLQIADLGKYLHAQTALETHVDITPTSLQIRGFNNGDRWVFPNPTNTELVASLMQQYREGRYLEHSMFNIPYDVFTNPANWSS